MPLIINVLHQFQLVYEKLTIRNNIGAYLNHNHLILYYLTEIIWNNDIKPFPLQKKFMYVL